MTDDVPASPPRGPRAPPENGGAATAAPHPPDAAPAAAAAAAAAAAKPPIYPANQPSRPAKPAAAPAAATSSTPLNPNHWSADMDIALFAAIANYKPVGAHRHFRMISVQRHFNCHSPRQLSTSEIWARLGQLYDLDLIEAANAYNEEDDESDSDNAADRVASSDGSARGRRSVRNPLERKVNFQLPPDDFHALMTERKTNASERGVGCVSGPRDGKSHGRAVSSSPSAAEFASKGKSDKESSPGAASAANPPLSTVSDSSVASGAPTTRKRKRTQAPLPPATATSSRDESEEEDEESRPKKPGRPRGRPVSADKRKASAASTAGSTGKGTKKFKAASNPSGGSATTESPPATKKTTIKDDETPETRQSTLPANPRRTRATFIAAKRGRRGSEGPKKGG